MTFLTSLKAIVTFIVQVFVIFPYSALTIRRQKGLITAESSKRREAETTPLIESNSTPAIMISDKVYKLCTSKESVSTLLAKDPTMAPGDAWKQLYGGHAAGEKESNSTAKAHRDQITPEDLTRALECGNWGPTQPSDLFLRLYHDALCTLDQSVSGCMVSPPLMGSCGVIPLTVISVVPDIMRHMSNLIVRADKEVILATNYWLNSVASKYITDAMKELSRRAGERGEKVVFKLEYDRGSPKQVLEPHYTVSEKEYLGKAVALPAKDEIPNLDLQVINYHRPMLGTFHCKYMVVDRKYAVLQSNNIQDNDNMEMMTHLEGPIVDSLYDMALISFHKKLEPPLPSHNSPAVQGGLGSFGDNDQKETSAQNRIRSRDFAVSHSESTKSRKAYAYEPRAINQPGVIPAGVPNDGSDINRADVLTGPSTTESVIRPANDSQAEENVVNGITGNIKRTGLNGANSQTGSENVHHSFENEDLGRAEMLRENARAAVTTGDFEHIAHQKPDSGPEMFTTTNDTSPSNGNGNGIAAMNGNTQHGLDGPDAVSNQFFNSGEQVLPQSQIEHPSSIDAPLPEHTTDDPHYDDNIAGEVARVQTAVSPKRGESRVEAVTRHLNHTKNVGFKGNAPECAPGEEMTPYIPHPVQEPFPIAMVCREPHGTPNHSSVYNPQNEVWLSALRNAKKNVFIQSPTLNAEPLVPAIIEACERGIDVYCYICLGYNDTVGFFLPSTTLSLT
ncbi:hypothetical protein B0J14DRAFT_477411 [Halenospora varia]|nr:hypothetical protein B0J14DRAFT_477411 [Halenospora varia]